ncbi:GNAT family N-acetyltransferase [Ruminiclostridium herbifermentans]|uniref:GNAT family N-acetyltransferase n=1 Tax=Ruminiclostridium herbifermentans TaxID=2488810 RepID=UPI001FD4EDAE|nr:N-acetyltransferase [Ruminiclostridium herbifermentans]
MTSKLEAILRKEQPEDYRIVEELTKEAFWNQNMPGCDEHYLLHIMRSAPCFIKDLDYVAEIDGKIVGNIVYTKATILDDSGKHHEVLSFGPVSVLPEYQGMGIGSKLIEHTKAIAKELGYNAILIYGDPDYYCRFGFVQAESFKIGTADNMYAPPLQALELIPGSLSNIKGRFFEDAVYHIDPAAAKEFDKTFPQKGLRDGLPSQDRFRYLTSLNRPRI